MGAPPTSPLGGSTRPRPQRPIRHSMAGIFWLSSGRAGASSESQMFLRTITAQEATGQIADIYKKQTAQRGFVMSATTCFTARPDLLPIYTEFSDKIRAGFSLGLREWRLITLIAAKQIPSTYCSHVYSQQLVGDLGSKDAVLAVQRDFRTAGLSDERHRNAGLRREDRERRLADFKSRHRSPAIRRIHRPTDLRHCPLCLVSMLRQPVLRRDGCRPGGGFHRQRRGIPNGNDRGQTDLRMPRLPCAAFTSPRRSARARTRCRHSRALPTWTACPRRRR